MSTIDGALAAGMAEIQRLRDECLEELRRAPGKAAAEKNDGVAIESQKSPGDDLERARISIMNVNLGSADANKKKEEPT
jgi:hypothetical protein